MAATVCPPLLVPKPVGLETTVLLAARPVSQSPADRQLAHARVLRARGSAMPPDGLPSLDVLDSWVRCVDAGLDAGARTPVVVVEAGELAARRERWAVARRLAQAELETLAQQISGSNFLLAFADREGVILDLYHDNRFAMSNDAGILAGSCWSEQLCGTNGLGTALAVGGSVAVTGMEHYFHDLGAISCTATPVRDAAGDIVGVLDASSYFESRQRHTQALVQMAATHIENGLLLHQMKPHWVLAVHPRSEFLGTLSVGLMAFDESGTLLAVNARVQQLLQGLRAAPGTRFDELFGESFERALPRLARGGEVRLRDVMGSALVATCANRPALGMVASRGVAQAAAPRAGSAAALAGAAMASADVARMPMSQGAPDGRGAAAQPVTADAAVQAAYELAGRAARMGVPVLIHGETGSGKELLARHVHAESGRRGAFVAVNCGALPQELFEAELFGYASGAFTGARREGNDGLIASADGGTLLLDEVRELPLALQAALLRFLDDQLVRPVGGTQTRRVDVLVVAASNADLASEVAAKRFRADLLYRLNTVLLNLPPLRERADLADCARAVLAGIKPQARLDDEALALLASHRWPGNFRELRSVLTRALLTGAVFTGEHGSLVISVAAIKPLLPSADAAGAEEPRSLLQQLSSERVRREHELLGGNVSRTAAKLGISRTTVYRHLRA